MFSNNIILTNSTYIHRVGGISDDTALVSLAVFVRPLTSVLRNNSLLYSNKPIYIPYRVIRIG